MPISNWKYLGDKTLYLTLSGKLSAEKHRELARTLENIAEENAFDTVILDNRDLEVTGRSEEARNAIKELAHTFDKAGVKRAVFIAAGEVTGSEHFVEAFQSLGGKVDVYPDFKSAVEALALSYSGTSPMVRIA